jgi:hypothetical protein
MKHCLIAIAFLFLNGTSFAFAQTPIPNGGMETWSSAGGGSYEEPSGGWWTSLNPLRSLGGPVTVSKSTDAHSGTYSAQLTSGSFGTLLVPGILISGVFNSGAFPNFIESGQPYTSKPLTFSGWFKYFPANGDSAALAVRLTRWNGSARELIAIADTVIYDSVPGWTSFHRPFQYLLPGATPDTIEVVAVSSKGGEDFLGQPGSTLFVDELELAGNFVSIDDPTVRKTLMVWPNPTTGNLHLSIDGGQKLHSVELLSLQGSRIRIWSEGWEQLEVGDLPPGTYLLQAQGTDAQVWTCKFHLLP